MRARRAGVHLPPETPERVACAAEIVADHLDLVMRDSLPKTAKFRIRHVDRARIVSAFRVMEALTTNKEAAP